MPPLRSTDLTLFVERCPAAVAYRRNGEPVNADGYATGIATHAMMQALGEASTYQHVPDPQPIIDRIAHVLITQGRSFDDRPEPPLPADAVLDARGLALTAWFFWPFPAGARCEAGLAIDQHGRSVPYADPAALARGILDLLYPTVIEVDGEPVEGVVVRDYKSAWNAGDADMPDADSRSRTRRQMRLYALFAYAAHPDAEFIRVEIANLRTLAVSETTIWLDEAGRAMLAGWLEEVRLLARAVAETPPQPRPGAGCSGCPYLRACRPGQTVAGLDDATRYAALDAERNALRETLASSGRRHPIPGGFVGPIGIERRTPKPDALIEAYRRFVPAEEAGALAYLAKLAPTMGNVADAIAALVPKRRGDVAYKAERAALHDALTVPFVAVQFKIVRED